MLKVCPAVNADLCSRKQSSGSDERVGKTDMCAVEATNPSARRIMYARRSIARCLLSYSKGFGLPASKMSFELLKRFRVTRETPILPLQGAGV